jgi:serine protease Do
MGWKKAVAILSAAALLATGCAGLSLADTLNGANATVPSIALPVQQATPLPVSSAPNSPSTAASDLNSLFEGVYAQVNPSVVNIQVLQQMSGGSGFHRFPANPFGEGPGQLPALQAQGSGFVWDSNGDIVTNDHVVNGASTIQVTFNDGTTLPAKVVGADPSSDLAVIHVSAASSELRPVTLGDSTQLKVGQVVIAIGNPYGLSGTMTQGVISALRRSMPALSTGNGNGPQYSIPDIIQTDAAINPGNSGGVLLDTAGHVVGVTSAIQSPVNANAGIGFVIPSKIVNTVVTSLINTGHYDHPYLGVSGTSLTYDLAKAMNLSAQQKGVLVVSVDSGGPAARAGLQGSNNQTDINGQQMPVGGDVITAIDGQAVNAFEDLSSILFNHSVGQTVTVTFLRNGTQQQTKVTLGVLPQQLGQ